MAVTQIRKISSWTLLISALISIVVLGLFFFGGVKNPGEERLEPVYTGLLLNWTFIIVGITLASTLLFAIWQVIVAFKSDVKSALVGIGALVLFIVLLFITYTIGDGTLLTNLNADSQEFNTEFWLRITDMWIYSTYVLVVLIIIAVAAGSVKKVLNR